MTLVRNKATRIFEADIRDGLVGRIHVSLRTKRKGEAEARHAAVAALIKQGNAELIHRLRKRQIRVEAVTRLHQATRPFEELLATSSRWPTLGAAVAAYLAAIADNPSRAANTYRNAEHYLRRVVEFLGADLPIELVTHERLQDLRAHVKTLGLKEWSSAGFLIRVNALFNWMAKAERQAAIREHRTARPLFNPVDPETIPKPGPGRDRVLSVEEATRLLTATPEGFRFPLICGLFAGLRVEEMLHLRPPPHDIDLETGTIIVQPRGEPFVKWTPKNKRRREVGIQPRLLPIVRTHLERSASPRWMCPSPYNPERPASPDWVARILGQVVRDAGLAYGRRDPMGITYHTLRHTFASWLVMGGTDLKTVATLLGHSTTRMVETTYSHLAPDHKRRAVERLGAEIPMAAFLGEVET